MKISSIFKPWLLSVVMISEAIATDLRVLQTVYNYENSTAYISIQDSDSSNGTIIELPFNSKYYSGQDVSAHINPPTSDSYQLFSSNGTLYAAYNDSGYLALSRYINNGWSILKLNNELTMFESSTYLTTFDDPSALFVFGGLDTISGNVSDRMVKIDLTSCSVSEYSTSIKPQALYGCSTLRINYNTELLVGGKVIGGWIGLTQMALWQYGSWAFKTVSETNSDTINPRLNPLLLPIFDQSSFETAASNSNFTTYTANSALVIGGNLLDSYSNPEFSMLNMSQSMWSWSSLDNTISYVNSKTNSQYGDDLSLDSILGAAVIYGTLVVVTNTSGEVLTSSKLKRDQSNYFFKLYNTTDFQSVAEVDYTRIIKSPKTKSNKGVIIALSTVIPILFLLIIAVIAFILYKHYKKKKEEEENEREIKEIMEFCGTSSDNLNSSLSPSNNSNIGYTSSEKQIKVNNYDDGDNLSINSWKRKREMYEQKRRSHLFPPAKRFSRNMDITDIEKDQERNDGSLLRRFTTLSSSIGKSLRRTFSYQSSVKSYQTSNSDDENPDGPVGSVGLTRRQSGSTLYQIPEDSSITKFRSSKSSPTRNSLFLHSSETLTDGHVSPQRSIMSSKSSKSGSQHSSPSQKKIKRFSLQSLTIPDLSPKPTTDPETDPFKSVFDDNGGIDENMDVQILVSSKRRSKLRITNPDPSRNSSILRPQSQPAPIQEIEPQPRTVSANDRSVSDSDNTRRRKVSDENKGEEE